MDFCCSGIWELFPLGFPLDEIEQFFYEVKRSILEVKGFEMGKLSLDILYMALKNIPHTKVINKSKERSKGSISQAKIIKIQKLQHNINMKLKFSSSS